MTGRKLAQASVSCTTTFFTMPSKMCMMTEVQFFVLQGKESLLGMSEEMVNEENKEHLLV